LFKQQIAIVLGRFGEVDLIIFFWFSFFCEEVFPSKFHAILKPLCDILAAHANAEAKPSHHLESTVVYGSYDPVCF
jgi:hypothetical protein